MTTATSTRPSKAKPAAAPAPAPITIGAAIDQAYELREKKRAAQKVVDALDEEIKALEITIFARLDDQETTKGAGKKASVSVSQSIVADVTDWPAFWAWVAKSKNFHLVQKRVSDPGIRELWQMHKTVPGVQPFTKRSLSLQTLSK